MKKIVINLLAHLPYKLRTYRFFDIGQSHAYADDQAIRSQMRALAERCYLPTNRLLRELIDRHQGDFRLSVSISGIFIDLAEQHAPEVLDSFRDLAQTGHVEFVAEPYGHSLASLTDPAEFLDQVKAHMRRVEELFGQRPETFRNTELIFSNEIGRDVHALGLRCALTEGARQALAWRSPNFVYVNPLCPKQAVLARNKQLCDDIALRFSDPAWDQWPLTADKLAGWLRAGDPNEDLVNLFLDYRTFGDHNGPESGIFDFLRHLPQAALATGELSFATPGQATRELRPISPLNIDHAISWDGDECDTTAWLGNDLQQDAAGKLAEMRDFVARLADPEATRTYRRLQCSDHLFYMSTKWYSDSHAYRSANPYGSPYDAYINFRNVLNDFMLYTGFAFDIRHGQEKLAKICRRQEEIIRELRIELVQARSDAPAPDTAGADHAPARPAKTSQAPAKPAKPAPRKGKAKGGE